VADKHEQAYVDYMKGMKYKDIADKYSVTLSTVKSWKQRYEWDRKSTRTKSKKVCVQKKDADTQLDDGTKETLQNDALTKEQQMFCIYYIRTFNATQSYMKAYGCDWETANTCGSRLMVNVGVVREEIQRLQEIKRQQIVIMESDVVELQMRIAFSDFKDIADYDSIRITPKKASQVDTQLIKKVKETQYGVSIEIEDRQKAIDWLTKHFLMHPEDKYRAEFDKKRAEVSDNSGEEILKNMKAIADILQNPVSNRKIEDYE
jgi:phage terminase small subunit